MPFLPWVLTPGTAPAPLSVALGGTGAAAAGTALANLGALRLVATTGAAGFTLANSTGTIVTWTVPSDGALHTVILFTDLHVTSNATGGDVNMSFTAPGGNTKTTDFIGAGKTVDDYACDFPQWQQLLIASGGTVTLAQNSALTAGAAVCYAQIWGI